MANTLEYRGITLIELRDGRLHMFNSSTEKEQFVKTHKEGTYRLENGCAICKLYMVIDTEGTGWNLTKKEAIEYEAAVDLINHYL